MSTYYAACWKKTLEQLKIPLQLKGLFKTAFKLHTWMAGLPYTTMMTCTAPTKQNASTRLLASDDLLLQSKINYCILPCAMSFVGRRLLSSA